MFLCALRGRCGDGFVEDGNVCKDVCVVQDSDENSPHKISFI